MVESFYQKRNLETVENFTLRNVAKELKNADQPIIFIGDLKGHYVTFMACKIENENG